MKYSFTRAKRESRWDAGLIPRAIKEAQEVSPAPELQMFWEGAVYKQLETPDPRFSWRNFLSALVP